MFADDLVDRLIGDEGVNQVEMDFFADVVGINVNVAEIVALLDQDQP